jgi:hypothetical protein
MHTGFGLCIVFPYAFAYNEFRTMCPSTLVYRGDLLMEGAGSWPTSRYGQTKSIAFYVSGT